MEVLIAVVILSLTAAASLKLAYLSEKTLSAVKQKEQLLDTAKTLRAKIAVGETEKRGRDGALSWEVAKREKEHFGKDFGRLDFDKVKNGDFTEKDITWHELAVTDGNSGERLTVTMPKIPDDE